MQKSPKPSKKNTSQSDIFKKVVDTLISILVLVFIILNATRGHFGYSDEDGCSCQITYTARTSNTQCEVSRANTCEYHIVNSLLFQLNYIDFYK